MKNSREAPGQQNESPADGETVSNRDGLVDGKIIKKDNKDGTFSNEM